MKLVIAGAAALSLLAGAALAQTSSSSGSSNTNSNTAASSAAAQKIKSELQSAGFKDVNVTAETFFVQATTKDGDPVMMSIGPHGMSMIETAGGKSSQNTNSNSSTSQSSK